MIILNFEQGSIDWQKAKLGVQGASDVSKMLAKPGTETRNSHLMSLFGQIATGEFDEINGKALDWGKANEASARAAYEFETGHKVEEVGFIYKDESRRAGCSPDGLMTTIGRGLELKCPMTARVHADFLANEKIKPEYILQCQWSMFVTGYQSWDFASYHPKFKHSMLKVRTIQRDEETMVRFEKEFAAFLDELDGILMRNDFRWGQQWE